MLENLSPTDEAILHSGLPIWVKAARLKMKQQEVLAALLIETGEEAPNATIGYATDGESKARGVPILGFGSGAILGTRPDTANELRPIEKLLGTRKAA